MKLTTDNLPACAGTPACAPRAGKSAGRQLTTNRGQALFIAAIFFLIISLTIVVGVVTPVINHVESARATLRGAQSLYAAEGVSQDVLYRLAKNMPVDAAETITYGAGSATATTTTVFDGKEIVSGGNRDGFLRKNKVHLTTGSGVSFNFGLQSGEGGIVLENQSSVAGSVYSNGPVVGSERNLIKGDVVSAGQSGRVHGVHATSSAYAHTIEDSTIDKDAYYQSIADTTVLGVLYPGSPDQATTTLPISDAQIAKWEADAEAGGTISSPCPYKITDAATLGPKKIACDLEISGTNYTLTLAGHMWVTGDITIKNNPTLKVAPSLGGASVALIADNPANRTTSSKIESDNSAVFEGSGSAGSFVLLLSQNRSAEDGGSETAINIANKAGGALLAYAGHGEILLQNTVMLKEVTAYKIHLKNSAEVHYESGLVSTLFTSGPGGGYEFDGWREIE